MDIGDSIRIQEGFSGLDNIKSELIYNLEQMLEKLEK